MVHPCQSLVYKTDTDSRNLPLSPCRPPIAVRHTRHGASGYTADTEWSSHHPGTCADTLGSLSYCGMGHTGCSCSASYTQTQGWWCHSLYTSHTCEWTIRNKINHRDYHFLKVVKMQKWEMHTDLQTMVLSGKKWQICNAFNISPSLTIYTSMFLWGPGPGVGPDSRCGSWCHTRHTAVVSPRHGASHSPHTLCSPGSASLLTESLWSPEQCTTSQNTGSKQS